MPDIDLGRYELDEDSNGNLVARDPNDNVVAQWDETDGAWDWGQTEHKNIGSLSTEELNNVYYAENFDGADGGARIQNALDHADAQPGRNRVVVGPVGPDNPSSSPESDVWAVSTRIDPTGYDHTELVGEGKPLLFLGDGADTDIIRAGTDGSSPLTDGFRVEGLRFHGNKANQGAKTGRDPDGDGSDEIKGFSGIRPINCSNWVIEDCDFQNFNRFGYCAKLTQGPMTVRDCVGDNCDDDGFTVSNQFFATQDPSTASHTFENCDASGNSDQGIEIEDGAANCVIRGGTLANNREGGAVKSHTGEAACKNVRWRDVDFISNTDSGLNIYGSEDGDPHTRIVSGCYIEQDSGTALNLTQDTGNPKQPIRDVKIKDTTIELSGSAGHGVYHRGFGDVVDCVIDVTIEVDSGASIDHGIRLKGGWDNLTLSPTIHGNGAIDGNGILAHPSSGPAYALNITEETHVEGCGTGGLVMYRDGNEFVRGRVGGTFKNNGQDSSNNDGSRVGILFRDLGGSTPITDFVFSADCYDDQGTKTQLYGIFHDGGDYNIFDGCNLRGNATAGFNGSAGANSVKGDNIT